MLRIKNRRGGNCRQKTGKYEIRCSLLENVNFYSAKGEKIIGRSLIKTRLKWESIVGAGIALGEVTGEYIERT